MKSQGLPMTTIVLLILVIIVLVGVAIFFFTGFGEGQEGLAEQITLSKCQSECAKIQAGASPNSTNFCRGYGGDADCDEYMSCLNPQGNEVNCY